MTDELNLDEILELEKLPQPKPKTSKSRKVSSDTRDIQTWLKLVHTPSRDCEVDAHEEMIDPATHELTQRPRNMGMTVIIDDVAVCRICFLGGADLK